MPRKNTRKIELKKGISRRKLTFKLALYLYGGDQPRAERMFLSGKGLPIRGCHGPDWTPEQHRKAREILRKEYGKIGMPIPEWDEEFE